MIHDRQRLPLRLEALHDRLVVHPGLDQLQGDLPPHRRGLFGQPDLPHAAFAKLADELKTLREDLSRFQASASIDCDPTSAPSGGDCRKLERTPSSGQQKRLHLGAQRSVGRAGLIEEPGTLLGRKLHGLVQ